MGGLKRTLSNKNIVTFMGVILAVVVLYFGYNSTVKATMAPISVPYAKQTISSGTKITSNMIGMKTVSSESVSDGYAYTNSGDVKDKYVQIDSQITKGSLFYKRSVIDEENLPDQIIYHYPKNEVLFYMSVDTETTYGNSIKPGDYIDIYLKAVNAITEGDTTTVGDKIMVGKLLENVKILAVLDSNGQNVFKDLQSKGTPSQMIFSVTEENFILLRKAGFLRAYSTSLIPVPTNKEVSDSEGTKLSSTELKDFINKVTVFSE